MTDFTACSIPAILLMPVFLTSNISMIFTILKKNGIRQSIYLLLAMNGLSNTFFGIQLFGHSALKRFSSEHSRHIDSFMKTRYTFRYTCTLFIFFHVFAVVFVWVLSIWLQKVGL